MRLSIPHWRRIARHRPPWNLLLVVVACAQLHPVAAGASVILPTQARVPLAVIDGIVTDSTLRPIPFATISIPLTKIAVQTTESGRFRIVNLPQGKYLLAIRCLGCRPLTHVVTADSADTLRVSYIMERIPVALDAQKVAAERSVPRLAGFDERRTRILEGKFITRADIVRQSPTDVTDLLRRLPGLRIADSAGTPVAVSTRGLKTVLINRVLTPVQCVMPIAVNGFIQGPSYSLNAIPPETVYGIEVYLGPAGIPPEFNGQRADTFCGLIVIWTMSD